MAVIIILVGGGTAKKDFIMVRIQGCSLLGLDLLGLNNIPHFVLFVCFMNQLQRTISSIGMEGLSGLEPSRHTTDNEY